MLLLGRWEETTVDGPAHTVKIDVVRTTTTMKCVCFPSGIL